MASTKEYLDFVLGQINGMDITYKKMMGEYLLYANGAKPMIFCNFVDDSEQLTEIIKKLTERRKAIRI